ncbi:UDP-N-acetylglucosamine 2-epimerase (non-hydrolyzing) [Telmatocola sphagniphila]|uniref:UDP-N-acetylglucosamine 2-epimerase (non-hydrolyzing) n=1 Tax=Telmatocola sphagniphila TaxID=1123043 RepID=A0A8E6EXD4_9BACT|nr:UDP-N-acetylglucosamine 2-epimerase (non-hydrolyzing) [Telmatocola sphagniphila]QVL31136.1 UDP-N-acetylglucosamine 2-epimerase (non-hydrolyzing) [Telmatocola sphagniphila]
MRKKIFVVFGTRPEIIKLAPVIRQLEFATEQFQVQTVFSGQHTDLVAPFVKLFGIRVDHTLQVMRPGQPLNLLFGRILQEIDPLLEKEKPDLVLVQGDTSTAAATALAAFHRQIPIGHVEAGLRTADPMNPFPEETNRRLVSRLASYHFAATRQNRQSLLKEGIPAQSIVVTGNPVVDALNMILVADRSERLQRILDQTQGYKRLALTTHRRESFGDTLEGNLAVLRDFVARHTDVALIFPVHPNPRVREAAQQHLAGRERIFLTEPLEYPDFIGLLQESWLIVSDSGGIQEEAPTLRKPVIVLRENTERPEAVEAGFARLAPDANSLKKMLSALYNDPAQGLPADSANPFGEGDSGQRITEALLEFFHGLPAQSTEATGGETRKTQPATMWVS